MNYNVAIARRWSELGADPREAAQWTGMARSKAAASAPASRDGRRGRGQYDLERMVEARMFFVSFLRDRAAPASDLLSSFECVTRVLSKTL